MALPRLNENPQYELTIPSTGEIVKYRPFLVKEQKVLILALESQDQRQVLNAILNCIDACIENVNTKKLATFDIEYIFTQIRSKSVGETTDVNLSCTACNEYTPVKINLDEIKLENEVDTKKKYIQLTSDIAVELKYPTYSEFLNSKSVQEDSVSVNMIYDMMAACIDAVIINDEERIEVQGESGQEVENFINSLNNEQFEKISEFVESIPKITMSVDYTCESCKQENTKKLEGLSDFFS